MRFRRLRRPRSRRAGPSDASTYRGGHPQISHVLEGIVFGAFWWLWTPE